MSKELRDLVDALGREKRSFLDGIENDIKHYISRQGKGCLTIVERYDSGGVCREWRLAASPDYVTALKRFYKGERYNGHNLDSALTDPVVDLVTKKFEKFYADKSDLISRGLLTSILSDKTIASSFVKTILDSTSARYATDLIKHKLVELLIDQLHSTLIHTTGTVAGGAVAKIVASVLLKIILLNFKLIVIKVLGSAAIKILITVALKKFIGTAIVAFLTKFIAAHFGVALGSAFMIVILPVIAGFIAYEIATFPEHLGEQVSKKVREDLSNNFDSTNTTILQKLSEEIIHAEAGGLGAAIADSKEVQDAINDLINHVR